jgi:DMSO/TMAO reductase YedYZ molybdopterin-dependent catalytic subunit
MSDLAPLPAFPPITGDPAPDDSGRYYLEELSLAFRNRGMPLEALRYPLTPTGLHYLLIHFDIPMIDAATWRLDIGGLVEKPLTLDLDAIKAMPAITRPVTMECAGNGRARMDPRPVSQPWLNGAIGTAEWTGTPLAPVLEAVGLKPGTVDIVFTGEDSGMEAGEVQRYQRSLTPKQVMSDQALLVYAMNGQPLEPQHGYPLRLLVPGWYGMTSVKWLRRIDAVDRRFDGHYMDGTYRYRDTVEIAGDPVTHQRVRSLMAPPGIPDFYFRKRMVEAGHHRLVGRAWAGPLAVTKVEVSTDSGQSWALAELEPASAACCWQGWHIDWQAGTGETMLQVRATDEAGNTQPDEPIWNIHGMGNNAIQKVPVIVR